MGVWGVEKVTVTSESVKVTGSPVKLGKITGTTSGGQIEVSSRPKRYVILYVNIRDFVGRINPRFDKTYLFQ